MKEQSKTDLCEEEIRRLHKFFVDWFSGSLRNSDEEFQKGVACFGANCHLITPKGEKCEHKHLLESIRNAHGVHQGNEFQIVIKNCQLLYQHENTLAMTYEEWQHLNSSTTARISTVIFHESSHEKSKECHLEWVHVHETWMPVDEKSS